MKDAKAPADRPRRSGWIRAAAQLSAPIGLLVLGSGVAVLVSRVPEALYVTAGLALTLCLLLFASALLVRRKHPRAEQPERERLHAWITAARGSGNSADVADLLARLGQWPHMLDDLSDQHRRHVAALVQEAAFAPTLRGWAKGKPRARRIGALHLLAWLRIARADATIADALQTDDPDVVHAAASALARFRTPSAYRRLLDLIDTEAVLPSRLATLLEDAPPDILIPLLEELFEPAERHLRFWIAHLAGRTRDPRALPLTLRLSRDPVEDVRANAAESLGRLGEESARARLHELLEDPSWVVQAHAAKGLRELGPAASAPLLTRLLTSSHWWVRENAVRALQAAGAAAEAPVSHLLPELSGDARRGAMDVLEGVS